jgi:hypothetical protein
MAAGGRQTHAREEREAAFYSRAHAEASLLRSEATNALRCGYGEPRREGAAGGSTAPRRARTHHVARGLTGRDAAWRCVQ